MRARGSIALLVFSIAACGNPQLSLDVQIPPSLKSMAQEINLHVYVPPIGGSFGCAEMELGKIDPDALALSESQVVRLMGRSDAPFHDIDRLSRNVLYVEALDANGSAIAVACGEATEFSNDVSLSLIAVPTARLEMPPNLVLSRSIEEVLPPRIPVRVLDALDQPIPGAQIAWTVASKEGVRDAPPRITDSDGRGDIDPDLPTSLGAFALVARASWMVGGPVELHGLVSPKIRNGRLAGLPLAAQVGRFTQGRDSIAVLFGFGVNRHIEFYDATAFREGADTLVPVASVPVADGTTLAKLEYPGEELDRIVTLATPGSSVVFTRFDPGGATVEKTTARPAGANGIRTVLNSGACRTPGRPKLTVIFDGDVVADYDEQGNLLGTKMSKADETKFSASGCLGDESGTSRRVLVRESPFMTAILEVDVGGMMKTASWLDRPGLLGFSPAIGGPEQMIANIIQESARSIALGRLRLDGAEPSIEIVASDPVEEVPLFTSGLDVDGDDRLDLVSVVTNDSPETGVRPYGLRLSMPDEYLGRRISGSIPIADDLCYLGIVSGDFDGDGKDDVLLYEVTPLFCNVLNNSRVFFFPMGG